MRCLFKHEDRCFEEIHSYYYTTLINSLNLKTVIPTATEEEKNIQVEQLPSDEFVPTNKDEAKSRRLPIFTQIQALEEINNNKYDNFKNVPADNMSPVKILNKLDRKKSLGELVYNQYPSFFEKTASSTADASEESTESLSEAVDN